MNIRNQSEQRQALIIRLLLSFVAITALFIGLAALADEVHEGDTLRYDEAILTAIHTTSTPWLDAFFSTYTDLSGVLAIVVLTLSAVGILAYKRLYLKSILIGLGVVGATGINLIVKSLFERTRPDLWTRIVEEHSFSFPSGHAMASSALALCIVAVLWRTKWRPYAIVLGVLYVATIGYSRLYLGVHYPTDVLAGWALSALWVTCVAISLYGYRYKKSTRLTRSPVDGKDLI